MGFFEFDELSESGPARSAPSGGAPRRTGGGGSTAAPRASTNRPAPATGRGGAAPAARDSRTATRPGAAPATRPGATPATRAAATPATTRPSPTTPARPSTPGAGFNFGSFLPFVQQGFDFVRQGTQIAQQFGAPPPRPSGPTPGDAGGPPAGIDAAAGEPPAGPSAPPAGYAPPTGYGPAAGYGQPTGYAQPAGYGPPAGYFPQPPGYGAPAIPQPYGLGAGGPMAPQFDQIGMLLQALRQHQIPPLPGLPAPPPPAAIPTAPVVPQADGMALLRLILGNPQFQQALQSGAVLGPAAPRTVELPLPVAGAPGHMRTMPIQMGAVLNAISALTGPSMAQLNSTTREDEPEVPAYLVDEDGDFIVDPASPDARAALVAHLFLLSDAAQRSGSFDQADGPLPEAEADGALDESDEWAQDAGFTR